MAAENVDGYKEEIETFSFEEINSLIINMEKEMFKAAEVLDFERAASLRDEIGKLKKDYGL